MLTFEDGRMAEADAVISCDRVKRPTRQAVLGDRYLEEHVKPTYSGKCAYQSVIPMEGAQQILGDRRIIKLLDVCMMLLSFLTI